MNLCFSISQEEMDSISQEEMEEQEEMEKSRIQIPRQDQGATLSSWR